MMLSWIDWMAERWLSWRSDAKIERFAVNHPEYGVNLERVTIDEDGLILGCISPAIALLAEEAIRMLESAHAPNYLQFDMVPRLARQMRAIRVTIQYADGASPSAMVDRLRLRIDNLIRVSEGWHSVEDCRAEGRRSCEFCAAIKQAQEKGG